MTRWGLFCIGLLLGISGCGQSESQEQVGHATQAIDFVYQVVDGVGVAEVEHPSEQELDTEAPIHTWTLRTSPVSGFFSGASGGQYFQAEPDIGAVQGAIPPGLRYYFDIPQGAGGNYTAYIRGAAKNTGGNSCSLAIFSPEGIKQHAGTFQPSFNTPQGVWTWVTLGPVALAAGRYYVRITMREDGTALDKLVFQRAELAPPTEQGPAESPHVTDGGPVTIASGGSALLPIVVGPTASSQLVSLANILKGKLDAITGASFQILTNGSAGIRLGVPGDFAEWPYTSGVFTDPSVFARQDFVIRSTPQSGTIALAGANPTAVENAVWELLARIGYRQYLASPIWEITPSTPNLTVNLDVRVHPAFAMRAIQYSFGAWPRIDDPTIDPYTGALYQTPPDCFDGTTPRSYGNCLLEQWARRNRMNRDILLSAGHTWDNVKAWGAGIYGSANIAPLFPNPSAVNHFCLSAEATVSNPDGTPRTLTAEQLIREYAANFFTTQPDIALSMDPGDDPTPTSPWCSGDDDAALSKSDVVARVANAAALGLRDAVADPSNRWIVIRSYSTYQNAPSVTLDDRIFVEIVTGDSSAQPWRNAWNAQYATPDPNRVFGIRTAFAAVQHWEQPGLGMASRPDGLAEAIGGYYADRATGTFAVEALAFGAYGFGHWLATRLLWQPDADINSLKADFLQNAFGPAAAPMGTFYSYLERPTLSTHWIGAAYRALDTAKQLAEADPTLTPERRAALLQRIRDLAVYVRYLELRRALISDCIYKNVVVPGSTSAPSKVDRLASILQLAFATRHTNMLPSHKFFTDPCRSAAIGMGVACKVRSVLETDGRINYYLDVGSGASLETKELGHIGEDLTDGEWYTAIKAAANNAPVTAADIDAFIANGRVFELEVENDSGIQEPLSVQPPSPYSLALVPANAPEPPDRTVNPDNAGLQPLAWNGGEQRTIDTIRWYVWPNAGSFEPLRLAGCWGCASGQQTPFSARLFDVLQPTIDVWSLPLQSVDSTMTFVINDAVANSLHAWEVSNFGDVDSRRWCSSDPPPDIRATAIHTCPVRMVKAATVEDRPHSSHTYDLLFYVPKNKAAVAGFAARLIQVYRWYRDDQGHWARQCINATQYNLSQCSDIPEHFVIPNSFELAPCPGTNSSTNATSASTIPPGTIVDLRGQGQLWKLHNSTGGDLAFFNIPPLLARHPREFLLPAEVVAADPALQP